MSVKFFSPEGRLTRQRQLKNNAKIHVDSPEDQRLVQRRAQMMQLEEVLHREMRGKGKENDEHALVVPQQRPSVQTCAKSTPRRRAPFSVLGALEGNVMAGSPWKKVHPKKTIFMEPLANPFPGEIQPEYRSSKAAARNMLGSDVIFRPVSAASAEDRSNGSDYFEMHDFGEVAEMPRANAPIAEDMPCQHPLDISRRIDLSIVSSIVGSPEKRPWALPQQRKKVVVSANIEESRHKEALRALHQDKRKHLREKKQEEDEKKLIQQRLEKTLADQKQARLRMAARKKSQKDKERRSSLPGAPGKDGSLARTATRRPLSASMGVRGSAAISERPSHEQNKFSGDHSTSSKESVAGQGASQTGARRGSVNDKRGSVAEKRGSDRGSAKDERVSVSNRACMNDKRGSVNGKRGSVKDKRGSVKGKRGSVNEVSGLSASVERRVSVKDRKGSVKDKRGSVKDKRGSVKDKRGSVKDKRGSVKDKRGSVKDKSSVKEKRSSVKDKSSVKEKRGSVKDKSSVKDKRGSVKDKMGSVEDKRRSTNKMDSMIGKFPQEQALKVAPCLEELQVLLAEEVHECPVGSQGRDEEASSSPLSSSPPPIPTEEHRHTQPPSPAHERPNPKPPAQRKLRGDRDDDDESKVYPKTPAHERKPLYARPLASIRPWNSSELENDEHPVGPRDDVTAVEDGDILDGASDAANDNPEDSRSPEACGSPLDAPTSTQGPSPQAQAIPDTQANPPRPSGDLPQAHVCAAADSSDGVVSEETGTKASLRARLDELRVQSEQKRTSRRSSIKNRLFSRRKKAHPAEDVSATKAEGVGKAAATSVEHAAARRDTTPGPDMELLPSVVELLAFREDNQLRTRAREDRESILAVQQGSVLMKHTKEGRGKPHDRFFKMDVRGNLIWGKAGDVSKWKTARCTGAVGDSIPPYFNPSARSAPPQSAWKHTSLELQTEVGSIYVAAPDRHTFEHWIRAVPLLATGAGSL